MVDSGERLDSSIEYQRFKRKHLKAQCCSVTSFTNKGREYCPIVLMCAVFESPHRDVHQCA